MRKTHVYILMHITLSWICCIVHKTSSEKFTLAMDLHKSFRVSGPHYAERPQSRPVVVNLSFLHGQRKTSWININTHDINVNTIHINVNINVSCNCDTHKQIYFGFMLNFPKQIVFTIFWLIWTQTKSENGEYNLISVDSTWTRSRFGACTQSEQNNWDRQALTH